MTIMLGTVETKLNALDLSLPTAPEPVGAYVPVMKVGNLVITSGQLPVSGKEVMFAGKIGDVLHESEGHSAARLCALNALAQIKACIGSLDLIKRIVRIEGYVASAPGFVAQAKVVNGASQLMVDLFGEAGKHTRIAVGVAELPLNASVELAVWAEVGE
jgi:enamine deaminase RidA (YjgF/YER057c/UK114 family)